MNTLDDMKAKTKLAQDALGKILPMVNIQGFWEEFTAAFNLALRAGNGYAAELDKVSGELEVTQRTLEQWKKGAEEKKAANAQEVTQSKTRVELLSQENAALQERIKQLEAYESHPVLVKERIEKRAAKLAELKRTALALGIQQAEDQARLPKEGGE